jgi:outer membrane biosynthesis protein TonB
MKAIILVILLSAGAFGCTHAQAKATPANPPLDMPEPPPRDVETAEAGAPSPVGLPQEPARNTQPRPRPAPTREQPRTEQRAEPPKPETPPPPATTVEPPKPATEEPPRPPTTVLTTPTGQEGDVERTIRATLERANTDLNRVNYQMLNADARTQYDYAKRFIRQAEDAIRAKNRNFAKTVADKAAAIAAQLAGR